MASGYLFMAVRAKLDTAQPSDTLGSTPRKINHRMFSKRVSIFIDFIFYILRAQLTPSCRTLCCRWDRCRWLARSRTSPPCSCPFCCELRPCTHTNTFFRCTYFICFVLFIHLFILTPSSIAVFYVLCYGFVTKHFLVFLSYELCFCYCKGLYK